MLLGLQCVDKNKSLLQGRSVEHTRVMDQYELPNVLIKKAFKYILKVVLKILTTLNYHPE